MKADAKPTLDDAAKLIAGPGIVGKSREFLQQGQRPELQRVQIERVSLRWHSD